MNTEFQSIFSSNENVDANLSKIFKRKVDNKVNKNELEDILSNSSEDDEEIAAANSKGAKQSLVKKRNAESENRTIFIGNLNCDCKKEELIKLFKSYGKLESVRFRNIVPEDLTKSKKFGFITKQQHPNKKTINAFVRFEQVEAARTAAEESNGMEYKSLHLRVDIASRSKVHDNKKSLFLGGLPFDISDEDVYKHFSNCGQIDFVRVIRDNKTGIGKGFGYVQFKTADSVQLGLRLDASTLNERKIRVTRCVKKEKPNKNDPNNKNRFNDRTTKWKSDGNKTNKARNDDRKSKQFNGFKNKPRKLKNEGKEGNKKSDKAAKKQKSKKKSIKKSTISTNSKQKNLFKI